LNTTDSTSKPIILPALLRSLWANAFAVAEKVTEFSWTP
jgi:hypothetical protein